MPTRAKARSRAKAKQEQELKLKLKKGRKQGEELKKEQECFFHMYLLIVNSSVVMKGPAIDANLCRQIWTVFTA
jgi:hypothetical protein